MRKLFTLMVALLIFICAGCDLVPPEREFAIRLKDRDEFLVDDFLLLDTNALTITVENFGLRPTGILSIELGGKNPGSFIVSPVNLSSIKAGESASFTVQPKEGTVQVKQKAVIEISNAVKIIDNTLNIHYREIGGLIDKALLYGTWTNGNVTILVNANTFIYRNKNSKIDVSCVINSWQEEEWLVGFSNSTIPVNTTLTVYRINCTVTEVADYSSPGNSINALFDIYPKPSPPENGRLNVEQEFTAFLLCQDWDAISGAGASGINIGVRDYNGNNSIPWVNCLQQ